MASIEKYALKNGQQRYRVTYRKPDHSQTTKRGFKRKRDAEDWAARNITIAINDGDYVDPKHGLIQVREISGAWLAQKYNLWKQSYRQTIQTGLDVHVLPKFGDRAVSSITKTQVQAWVNELAETKSPTVVLRAFGILKGILTMAKNDQRIRTLRAVEGISLPYKSPRATDRHYLTPDQLIALANHADRYRTLVLILGLCGLRWGEAAGLTPRYVNLNKKRISVRKTIIKVGTQYVEDIPKSWESRDVPIPDKLLPLLQNTLKGLGKDDLVFTDPDGHSIRQQHTGSGSNNWWSRALDSADLEPMRIHDLRHTAASIAVSAGANVKALQNMLGHKSAAMTLDTYADLFDSDLEALGENINAKIPDLEVAA